MSRHGEEMVLAPGAGAGARESSAIEARLRAIWHDIKFPLLVFLLVRIYLSVAVYYVAPMLPASPVGMPWSAFPGQPLLDVWARWDSGWYANIALEGYRFASDQSSNIAFLPLYPLTVKAVGHLTGNVWMAGILISNLAFLGSLILLFKLAQLKFGRAAASRAVLYASVFPASFFFYAMYSESIYLLTLLLAFYLWEQKKGWPAGIFGGLAALTRPMGILLFLSGLVRQFVEERHRQASWVSWQSASLLIIPAALGAFLIYSYLAFGQPLAFLTSREVGWNEPVSLIPISHREFFASAMNGTLFTGGLQRLRLLDAASGVFFLFLSVPVFRWLGPSYGVFALGSIVMPLIVNLDGLSRYVSVIFPAFMVLGRCVPKKGVVAVAAGLSAALMALLASMFSRWYFVG